MAPPIIHSTTKRTTTALPENGTSATWSARVRLKPTRFYPPMPFHLFPDDHIYLANGVEYSSSHNGTVSPLVLQIIGVVAIGFILFISLCCTRYHLKRRLRKYQIKGNMSERRPSWTQRTPVLNSSDINISWHRRNMGSHVTLLSSRSIFVDLQQHFAASARPNAQGERLANPSDITMIYEGAMSDRGFCNGRHIFAFMWPRDQRYANDAYLAFGLGYPSLDLRGSDDSILGGSRKSMAFDVIKNELFFNYAKIGSYPPKKPRDFCVPTLIYMYVDLDGGKLSFSSETEYWGTAFNFTNMRKNRTKPLHIMVSFRAMRGKIMMFYKGTVPDIQNQQTIDNSSTHSSDSGIECNKIHNKAKDEEIVNEKTNGDTQTSQPYTFHNLGFQADDIEDIVHNSITPKSGTWTEKSNKYKLEKQTHPSSSLEEGSIH